MLVALACLAFSQFSQLAADPAVRTGRVEGVVRGPLGEPLVAIEVWAGRWPDLDRALARTRTDGQGMFVFGRLPAEGGLWIQATAKGLSVGFDTVDLRYQPVAVAELCLWEAHAVAGRVVDPDGAPVVGAAVLATHEFPWLIGRFRAVEAVTDDDGRFQLAGCPNGACAVRTWKPGFALDERRDVALADQTVEVRLARAAGPALRVVVTDLDEAAVLDETVVLDEIAVAQARLGASRGGYGMRVPMALALQALPADRRLSLQGLLPAQWRVEVVAAGWSFAPRAQAVLLLDHDREASFAASRVGKVALRGTLRNAGGEALVGETVTCAVRQTAAILGPEPVAQSVTDADGAFAIVLAAAAGEAVTVRLLGSKYILVGNDAEVGDTFVSRAAAEGPIALVGVRGETLSGRVVDPAGEGVPFVRVRLLQDRPDGDPQTVARTWSLRDGSFTLRRSRWPPASSSGST